MSDPDCHLGARAGVLRPGQLLRGRVLAVLDHPGLAVATPDGERRPRREQAARTGLARHGREEELSLTWGTAAASRAATSTATTAPSAAATPARAARTVTAGAAAPADAILRRGQPAQVAAELAAIAGLLLRAAGLVEHGQHGLDELGHHPVGRQQELLHLVTRPGGTAVDVAAPPAVDLVRGDLQVGLEPRVDRRLEKRLEPITDLVVVGIEGAARIHQRGDVALGLAEGVQRGLAAFLHD